MNRMEEADITTAAQQEEEMEMESVSNLKLEVAAKGKKALDLEELDSVGGDNNVTPSSQPAMSNSKPEDIRLTPVNPNLISWLFISWMDKLMWLGYKRPLEFEVFCFEFDY
jgi:hypothetical protein